MGVNPQVFVNSEVFGGTWEKYTDGYFFFCCLIFSSGEPSGRLGRGKNCGANTMAPHLFLDLGNQKGYSLQVGGV